MKPLHTTILKFGQKGFTLIELIITIVIIGVLAAVAIPKFQSLTADAESGVSAGVAAALASATSVNYARSKVPTAVTCTAVGVPAGCTFYPMLTCTALDAVKATLADIPTGYSVVTAAGGGTLTADGVSAPNCGVQKGTGSVITFNAYGA